MPWGVAAGAAASLASAAISSSGGSSNSQQTNSGPWAAQQPYLQDIFGKAQTAYGNAPGSWYTGPIYAGLNDQQLRALGQNGGPNGAGGTGLAGWSLEGGNGGAGIAGSQVTTGQGTVGGIQTGQNSYGTVLNRGLSDPTAQITNDAGIYTNNPTVKGMITAAQTPIQQELTENQLPQLNEAAIGGNNTDSSRAAVAQAILQRNAATQESNVAAQIENNAYNTGVNTASGLYTSGTNAALGAAGGQLNTGVAGGNLLEQGYNTTLNNLNIPLQVGGVEQANTQGADTAGLTTWQNNTQYPWTQLGNYEGLVAGNYGTNGTVTQNPSTLSNISGSIGTGLGIYGAGKQAGWWGNNGTVNVGNGMSYTPGTYSAGDLGIYG